MKRKSIGKRVLSFIILIGVIYVGVVAANIAALSKIQNRVGQLSSYLDIAQVKGDLSTYYQQTQMYVSLSYYEMDKADNITRLKELSAILEEDMDKLIEEVEDTQDDRLIDAVKAWDTELEQVSSGVNDIASGAASGDVMTLVTAITNIQQPLMNAREAEKNFDSVLADCKAEVTEAAELKTAGTKIFNNIAIILGFGALSLIVLVVAKTISKPARKSGAKIKDIVDKIEKNEGDLTERLAIQTNDEIGQMANGVNHFLEQLQNVMLRLKDESERLNTSTEIVRNQITESNNGAESVSATMEEMSASMAEMSENLGEIAIGTDAVLEDLQTVMNKTSDGLGIANDIQKRAAKMHEQTLQGKENTGTAMGQMRETLLAAVEESRSVEKINELTGEILNIASQTNLLALNASIEAARAGEAGKGFAVVADEIRQLADNSRETANKIQEISNMVTSAVEKLAQNAGDMVQFVDDKVMSDYDGFVEIVEQYEADATNIQGLMTDISSNTTEVEHTMDTMNNGINNISAAIEETAKGVALVAENAVELVDSISNIVAETENNEKISIALSEEVSRFKKV